MPVDTQVSEPPPVAIFGGSFNPPGLHHILLAQRLAEHFPLVRIVPCGFRNDKVRRAGDWMEPELRRRVLEASFGPLIAAARENPQNGRFELDLRDLDQDRFSTTWELAKVYGQSCRPHFVVGGDLLTGGGSGNSQIQVTWYRGTWIWDNLDWICLQRPGFSLAAADLPPRHTLIHCDISGSSSLIRDRLGHGQSVADLVTPEVARLLTGLPFGIAPDTIRP